MSFHKITLLAYHELFCSFLSVCPFFLTLSDSFWSCLIFQLCTTYLTGNKIPGSFFSEGDIDFLSHYRLVDSRKLEPYARAFVVEDIDFDTIIGSRVHILFSNRDTYFIFNRFTASTLKNDNSEVFSTICRFKKTRNNIIIVVLLVICSHTLSVIFLTLQVVSW